MTLQRRSAIPLILEDAGDGVCGDEAFVGCPEEQMTDDFDVPVMKMPMA
jgi:hypothetical protein